MLQKKFLCKDLSSACEAIDSIGKILSDTPHKSALVTFYETGFSENDIRSLISRGKELGYPELLFAGITLPVIAELIPEVNGILINLILTEDTDISVLSIPCLPGKEIDAARRLRKDLDDTDNVKAVELFGSNMELNTTVFIENFMEGHEDAVLFGTTTIRNLSKKMSVEEDANVIEVEAVSPEMAGDEFVIADYVIRDGFVAVVFAGERLEVKAEYALGWKPIGRSFSATIKDISEKGETCITTIDGAPAVDIYREYLGVYPDPYFISNICEFPLVVERDGIDICLIPLEYGKDGQLYFMMTVNPGEDLRFTFASHDDVLNAARESLRRMEQFSPEVLFLTLCGNRINFLKEDAHLEWDGFNKVAPDHALMHGACELFYHEKKGGILNSAHLSIGMKESEKTSDDVSFDHITVESLRKGRVLSLSDRMSIFLDKITSELLDTANQAKDANNAKTAFLSHMSHEIRTPINAILGMDEMILKESNEDEILDYADSIRSASNNLLSIVNDILDLSKIEAGKMNIIPTEYEFMTQIKDLYNIVRIRARDKGLSVGLDIDPLLPGKLFGDAQRLKQVVSNLLTNAVKYTEEGSVTLKMEKVQNAADDTDVNGYSPVRIRVSVSDTGIGIKPEDMEKLFDEYERFDEIRNQSIEGTGLGLSIVRKLLELMGCRLFVESTYGSGSTFGFEVVQGIVSEDPIGDVMAALKSPVAKKHRVRFTAEDARILIVDDSEINLKVITKLLKDTKIKIDTALSGKEAIELVKENAYDVIFLDHLMPGMDGPETLLEMNRLEDNRSSESPVISLTANALNNAKEEYLKLGFKDYLSKPIIPEQLEDMLFYHIPPEKIRTINNDA